MEAAEHLGSSHVGKVQVEEDQVGEMIPREGHAEASLHRQNATPTATPIGQRLKACA